MIESAVTGAVRQSIFPFTSFFFTHCYCVFQAPDTIVEAIPPQFANDPDSEGELPPVPPPPGHGDDEVVQEEQVVEEEEESSSSSEGEDLDEIKPEFTGQLTLGNGNVIDKASAAFLKKRKSDPESEDEYGYTLNKIHRKYKRKTAATTNGSELVYVNLNRGTNGLGISLAGELFFKTFG